MLEFRRVFCHEHVCASTSIALIEPTLSWSMTFFPGVKERELGSVLSALFEDWCCAPKFAESTTSCQCAHANSGTWYLLHAYLACLLSLSLAGERMTLVLSVSSLLAGAQGETTFCKAILAFASSASLS